MAKHIIERLTDWLTETSLTWHCTATTNCVHCAVLTLISLELQTYYNGKTHHPATDRVAD